MQGQQGRLAAVVPGRRRGLVTMFLLTPLKRTPRDRRTRLRMAVRAVRYRRGGMFLAALRWYAARADTAAPDLAAYEATTLAAADTPADDLTPALPVLLARVILTAAPPALPRPGQRGSLTF